MMSKTISNKFIFIPIFLIAFAIITETWLLIRQLNINFNNNLVIRHTYLMIKNLDQVLIDTINIETGIRGYALLKDPRLLEPYHVALNNIEAHLTTLNTLTVDNEQEHADLKKLQVLIREKIEHSKKLVINIDRSLADSHQIEQDKRVMDNIRIVISRLKTEQENILDSKEKKEKMQIETHQQMAVGMTFVLLLLLFCYVLFTTSGASKQEKIIQNLQGIANFDQLTGVYSRWFFMERGEEALALALRYKHDFSVLMLDIDYFKKINDNYGHAIGDDVLQKFTQLCQIELREADIIGRLGGEEFAIILPETSADRAIEVAERLRVLVAESGAILSNKTKILLTVSIGVASLNKAIFTLKELLREADQALYSAKKSGRNCVIAQHNDELNLRLI